jgi:hypothetical protein
MDDGVTSPRRSWWPFSSARPSNTSARDDGSVDYVSLNEDWASRSQDDPLWWTKDNTNNDTNNTNNNNDTMDTIL